MKLQFLDKSYMFMQYKKNSLCIKTNLEKNELELKI